MTAPPLRGRPMKRSFAAINIPRLAYDPSCAKWSSAYNLCDCVVQTSN